MNRHVLRGSLIFIFMLLAEWFCSNANLAVEQTGECSRIKLVLLLLNALVKRLGRVVVEYWHDALRQNRAGVDAAFHQVDGAAGGLDP